MFGLCHLCLNCAVTVQKGGLRAADFARSPLPYSERRPVIKIWAVWGGGQWVWYTFHFPLVRGSAKRGVASPLKGEGDTTGEVNKYPLPLLGEGGQGDKRGVALSLRRRGFYGIKRVYTV